MSKKNKNNSDIYKTAQKEAVYYVQPNNGYIRFADEGRIDFLDRLTSNAVTKITPEKIVTTVLTSSIGRILDVFQLIDEGEILGAITLPNHAQPSTEFLKGKIFFMDKVSITDHSDEYAQIDLEGPEAIKVLQTLDITVPAELEGVSHNQVVGIDATILSQKGLTHSIGYRILIPQSNLDKLTKALQEQNIPPIDTTTREILRIEAGIPGPDTELNQDFNPLETDTAWAVSNSKGCYPGQEVIARQVNYDKITKKLVQLKLNTQTQPGATVRVEGKNIGTITSSVESPQKGPIALAVLKRPHNQPGVKVIVESDQGEIPAEITF